MCIPRMTYFAVLKYFTTSQCCINPTWSYWIVYFDVWMVHLSFLEKFLSGWKRHILPSPLHDQLLFQACKGNLFKGKIMHMNIVHVLIYKERIPREQNRKSFEKAYTDHRSAAPNCLIFQILPHTMLRIPQKHLTLCSKHFKFLKTQQQQRKHKYICSQIQTQVYNAVKSHL